MCWFGPCCWELFRVGARLSLTPKWSSSLVVVVSLETVILVAWGLGEFLLQLGNVVLGSPLLLENHRGNYPTLVICVDHRGGVLWIGWGVDLGSSSWRQVAPGLLIYLCTSDPERVLLCLSMLVSLVPWIGGDILGDER